MGKVLASEIVRPKACSLRTLDMIRNMSPEEANNSETGQGSGKKPDNDGGLQRDCIITKTS